VYGPTAPLQQQQGLFSLSPNFRLLFFSYVQKKEKHGPDLRLFQREKRRKKKVAPAAPHKSHHQFNFFLLLLILSDLFYIHLFLLDAPPFFFLLPFFGRG
jgi:hypothetical protein